MAVNVNRIQPEYVTGDIWGGCYLLAMGVPLARTEIDERGRTRWVFDNTDDKAWQEGLQYREGYAVAPVFDIKKFYRLLSGLAQSARAEHVDDGNNNTN